MKIIHIWSKYHYTYLKAKENNYFNRRIILKEVISLFFVFSPYALHLIQVGVSWDETIC